MEPLLKHLRGSERGSLANSYSTPLSLYEALGAEGRCDVNSNDVGESQAATRVTACREDRREFRLLFRRA